MARDYAGRGGARKRPAPRHTRNKDGLPGWLWMIVGLSIGLVVAAVVYIGRPTEAAPAARPPGPPPKAAAAPRDQTAAPQLPPKEKPRFSFYELLPSYEVVIPKQTAPKVGGKPPQIPAVEPGQYVVQVGSFRSPGDAETQKAKLALLGIESRVESVTIDNRDTWYRVRIGPLSDPGKVRSVLQQLEANGVDSFLMRVRS